MYKFWVLSKGYESIEATLQVSRLPISCILIRLFAQTPNNTLEICKF